MATYTVTKDGQTQVIDNDRDELVEIINEMRADIAQLRRDMANMVRIGTVSDTDAEKGYRLQFSTDDGSDPKKSPWLPHPEQGGGATSWVPLWKGQVVTTVSPPGDPRQALLMRGGFTDAYQQPSKVLTDNVFEYDKSRMTVRKDEIRAVTVTLNKRAQETANLMGVDAVKIQGKNQMIKSHTDKDQLMLARRSILIQAPSVTISLSDPGSIEDVVKEETAA